MVGRLPRSRLTLQLHASALPLRLEPVLEVCKFIHHRAGEVCNTVISQKREALRPPNAPFPPEVWGSRHVQRVSY